VRYAEHGWTLLGIHRADLQEVLLGAAGCERVRLGAQCTGLAASDQRVTAKLADGSEEEGDLLIGADGIDSVVRGALLGEAAPRYSGYAGWRAVADLDLPELRGIVSETWGPRDRFGLVPIGAGRLYWFVSESVPHGSRPHARPKEEFLRRFASWHDPIPRVVEATPEDALSRTFVYDLRPLREWGRGRVTLLGDAAHAMAPNLSQGAAQSLEDAVVLGRELERGDGVEAALRRYEARRRKRANGLIRASRQAGWLAQRKTAAGCAVRDALVRALPEPVGNAQQARLVAADLD
jgi:2-polyprenyl-6-methoxyphenol hydroxylase-like FAD-dependent oxidoreductase